MISEEGPCCFDVDIGWVIFLRGYIILWSEGDVNRTDQTKQSPRIAMIKFQSFSIFQMYVVQIQSYYYMICHVQI